MTTTSSNHEFHETCHSVTFYFMKKYSTTPESIHTKDESEPRALFAVKSWGGDTSKVRRREARDAKFGGSDLMKISYL